jgi:hypothetical protein
MIWCRTTVWQTDVSTSLARVPDAAVGPTLKGRAAGARVPARLSEAARSDPAAACTPRANL